MSPKPGNLPELVEPLRNFLESFTQELTQQQFIPAFRDELKRLISTLENLQQSEDTLQHIAQGVERLRDVFAPSSARLMDGVKEMEALMHINASELKDRSNEILKQLQQTHEQLETSLRNDAGLLLEQTALGRHLLEETVADIENRMKGLADKVGAYSRQAEQEIIGDAEQITSGNGYADPSYMLPVSVTAHFPEEIKELLAKTENTVTAELERYRNEIQDSLSKTHEHENSQQEKLARLDKLVSESLSAVAPQVQEQIDSSLGRLWDQLRTLARVEHESGTENHTAPEVSASAVIESEQRILRELAEVKKSAKHEHSSAAQATNLLIEGLADLSKKQNEKLALETKQVKLSLNNLLQKFQTSSSTDPQLEKKLAEGVQEILNRMQSFGQALEQKQNSGSQSLESLQTQLAKFEKAAVTATEQSLAESRTQRDKMDASLKDLRAQMEKGFESEERHNENALVKLAAAWSEEMSSLGANVAESINNASKEFFRQITVIETDLEKNLQNGQKFQQEISTEFKRATGLLSEKIEGFYQNSEQLSGSLENHVKAVSSEVSLMRSTQEKALAVLKEAIRANYDDNAARLKEIIETSQDAFEKRIAMIPQALERYTHFMESLHKTDHLALEAIAGDTKNILKLSTERFQALGQDNDATKKYFPLLDKKLEKHNGALDGLRKGQTHQEKELREIKEIALDTRELGKTRGKEMRDEYKSTQIQQLSGFQTTKQAIDEVMAKVDTLRDADMPAFKKELSSLLVSKFEFIETTVNEKQEQLRAQLKNQLEQAEHSNRKTSRMYMLLLLLSIAVQIALYYK